MKNLFLAVFCSVFVLSNMFSQGTKQELEKSQKAGKNTFLIIYDKTSKGTEELIKMAEDAGKKAKNTVVIKLNKDDKSNGELITKYRLEAASLPLVLILAPNGAISAGFTSENASVEKLISFIPSKTQADVLLGFQNGKAAFIVCGKKNSKDKTALETECKKAITNLGNNAIQVFVDVDSKNEENFLALLKPDKTKTTVLIFNGKGQYTGTLESKATSAELVATVNKKIGGCCSSGGSCGSNKK